MKLTKIGITILALFLAAMMPAFGQKEEKEQPQERPAQQQEKPAPQQHAQQAKPAQQRAKPKPRQRAAQARPAQKEAKPSPARAQQAKVPAHPQEQHAKTASRQKAAAPQAGPSQNRAQPNVSARGQSAQPQRTPQQAQSWQQQRGWNKQGGGWQPHANFQQGRDQNWASDHRSWAQRGGYGGSYIPQASFGLYFGRAHYFHIGAMPVMYMGYPRFTYSGYSFMLLDPWPGSWQENWYASDDVYIDYSDGYYLHDRRYPGIRLAVTVAL